MCGDAARAQTGFDRPGGDYARFVVPSGDPAVCAARCDRDGRCRAWTFSYPGTAAIGGSTSAICWLKNEVTPRGRKLRAACPASRARGLVEMRPGPVEISIDRTGGDYRHFDLASDPTGECLQEGLRGRQPLPGLDLRAARATSGASARCYLKDKIKPPRRKPCCMSGVVR